MFASVRKRLYKAYPPNSETFRTYCGVIDSNHRTLKGKSRREKPFLPIWSPVAKKSAGGTREITYACMYKPKRATSEITKNEKKQIRHSRSISSNHLSHSGSFPVPSHDCNFLRAWQNKASLGDRSLSQFVVPPVIEAFSNSCNLCWNSFTVFAFITYLGSRL